MSVFTFEINTPEIRAQYVGVPSARTSPLAPHTQGSPTWTKRDFYFFNVPDEATHVLVTYDGGPSIDPLGMPTVTPSPLNPGTDRKFFALFPQVVEELRNSPPLVAE